MLVVRCGLLLCLNGAFDARSVPLLRGEVLECGGKLVHSVWLGPVRFWNNVDSLHLLPRWAVPNGHGLHELHRVR